MSNSSSAPYIDGNGLGHLEMAVSLASCIFSISAGNDFQQARGNQGMRHFQMSSMSAPTGDDLRWTSPAGPGRGGASGKTLTLSTLPPMATSTRRGF
jgi:hypothetical protein